MSWYSVMRRSSTKPDDCVAEIIVSSPRAVSGYRAVADLVPDVGSLAGIAGGLAAATTPRQFVVAGDMPYVPRAFIDFVLSHGDAEADAVGIRIRGLPKPLCRRCVLRCGVRL